MLRPPVSIITPACELELTEGSLLAGRLPECDVTLDDGLVSRMHARLSVRDSSVIVEDLHSTNGVYVNGSRITRSAVLREGDRLLFGTSEISLFEARPSARVAPLRSPRGTDAPPASPARPPSTSPIARLQAPPSVAAPPRDAFGKLDLHLDEFVEDGSGPPSARGVDLKGIRSRSSGLPSTARADALEVIGALAERLATGGNVHEARRVISSHLKRILHGATAGLTVPPEVCLLASRHALSVARYCGDSEWIDYVVELHLAASRVMHPDTLQLFESVALSVGRLDRQLLGYYVEGLREERALLADDERAVVERLARLVER